MNSTRRQVLHLYRTVLKRTKTFPLVKTNNKIRFNIRDALDYYRNETDPETIKGLLNSGQLFLSIMDDIENLRPEHLKFLLSNEYSRVLYDEGVRDLREWEKTLDSRADDSN